MDDPAESPSKLILAQGSAAVYESLVRNVTGYAIYMLDRHGRVATWNAGGERAHGYAEAEIVGHYFSCFYSREDQLAGLPEANLEAARTLGTYNAEGWRIRKDGTHFWAHVLINALHEPSGGLIGFAKITRDCTEDRRQRRDAMDHERRFRLLVEGVTDYAIYMLDPHGVVSNWNTGAQRAKGYTAAEIVGRHFSCFYDAADQAAGKPEEAMVIALRTGKYNAEGWRLRKDGSRFWANVHIEPIYDEVGDLFGFSKITRDCSQQRASSLALLKTTQRLEFLARHDALTGPTNRFDFQDRLGRLLSSSGEASRFALLYLDLDDFKAINDGLGHHAGDEVLIRVASRLKGLLPHAGQLSRLVVTSSSY